MDDLALFEIATRSARNGIDRAAHLLGRADDTHLTLQLVPHMFDFAGQIRTVTIFALRSTLTPIGRDWSLAVPGADRAALTAQFDGARADIAALTAEDFAGVATRRVQHEAGDAQLDQSTQDYLLDFALPNMWFHLSMGYAILRQAGVDVGKADFDGLHQYQKGFSWV